MLAIIKPFRNLTHGKIGQSSFLLNCHDAVSNKYSNYKKNRPNCEKSASLACEKPLVPCWSPWREHSFSLVVSQVPKG